MAWLKKKKGRDGFDGEPRIDLTTKIEPSYDVSIT